MIWDCAPVKRSMIRRSSCVPLVPVSRCQYASRRPSGDTTASDPSSDANGSASFSRRRRKVVALGSATTSPNLMLAGATVGDGVGDAVGLGLAATVGAGVGLGDGVGAGRVVHATTANANTRTPSRRTPLVCQVREPDVSYRPRTVTATRPSDRAEASSATP